MSDLAVPQHIEAERRAQNEARQNKDSNGKSSVQDAYVEPTELVLNPSLLDSSLLERMPKPTGWRLLVLPYKGKGVTDGGIVLPDSVIDREALATVIAYVLKLGPLAYKDSGKFNGKPWCQAKDWVLIGRYAGARFKLEDGAEVRIINDDEVIGTILNPDDIQSL
jgi:co-chaperonin GroES (HSP10)